GDEVHRGGLLLDGVADVVAGLGVETVVTRERLVRGKRDWGDEREQQQSNRCSFHHHAILRWPSECGNEVAAFATRAPTPMAPRPCSLPPAPPPSAPTPAPRRSTAPRPASSFAAIPRAPRGTASRRDPRGRPDARSRAAARRRSSSC